MYNPWNSWNVSSELQQMNFDHEMTNFTCNNEIILMNTTLIGFNCFSLVDAEIKANMCDEACVPVNARRPYFDEFMGLSRKKL